MCGISGFYKKNLTEEEIRSTLYRMNHSLKHRGPDSDGLYIDSDIGLGHTRLSIRELSDLGSQPMLNYDKSIVLSFNGEIYNFFDIKDQLETLGAKFRGKSDTEVLLKTYEYWGLDGLKRLEGMFAFAIWDKFKERLILMRDRLGIKPLFYMSFNSGIIFGSEIKAIKSSGFFDNEIDNQALSEYLWYGNSFEEKTIYKKIKNLLPGSWLIFQKGNLIIEKYWKLEDCLNKPKFKGTKSECLELLDLNLNKAVKRQYSADVPVSLFLSGGVDSTALALASMGIKNNEKKAYTALFNEKITDLDFLNAKKVASNLDLDHRLLSISEKDLNTTVNELVKIHDEPFADSANIPLYLMSKEFNNEGKVIIQGDGGDELFAGYRQHSVLLYSGFLSKLPNIGFKSNSASFDSYLSRFNRLIKISKEKNQGLKIARTMTMELFEEDPLSLFTKEKQISFKETDPFLVFKNLDKRLNDKELFEKMIFTELTLQLPSQFLTKVDRATMAASVESRVPLLDDQFVEFSLSIPYHWNINFFRRKILLRKYVNQKLPKSIANSPKSGFGVPYGSWIYSKLFKDVEDNILNNQFIEKFGLDKSKVNELFLSGRRNNPRSRFLIWKIYQLSKWYHLVHNAN